MLFNSISHEDLVECYQIYMEESEAFKLHPLNPPDQGLAEMEERRRVGQVRTKQKGATIDII